MVLSVDGSPVEGSELRQVLLVTGVDGRLVLRRSPNVTGREHCVVVVDRREAQAQLEPRSSQNSLQGRDTRLPFAALDLGDLRLSDASKVCQLALRDVALLAGEDQQCSRGCPL